jgi:hypothetical protein
MPRQRASRQSGAGVSGPDEKDAIHMAADHAAPIFLTPATSFETRFLLSIHGCLTIGVRVTRESLTAGAALLVRILTVPSAESTVGLAAFKCRPPARFYSGRAPSHRLLRAC